MRLDRALVDAAIELAETRWPTGESGAAAMYTEDGRILTSVFAENSNVAAGLCHETGAICEAHKLDVVITASVCVSRETENDPFVIQETVTPVGNHADDFTIEPVARYGHFVADEAPEVVADRVLAFFDAR